MNVRKLWAMLKEAFGAWQEDYAPSMGAALSYYTLFSIAPLLLIVIAVAGLVFGEDAARGAIVDQLQGLMGQEGAKAIESMIASVNKPTQGIIATVIGVATLLLGATTVFGELQTDLDRIWHAPAREQTSGLWALLRTRLLSFGMILGIAFLLMVSLVVSAAVSALGTMWAPLFGAWEVLAHALNIVVGFGVTTVLFAMIYKFMPRVAVSWHDVWIGSAFTALLFTVGRFLIGLYLGKSSVTSGFGAAGSLVLVMVWVYYSAQIFLLGAEFTWVYAHEFGSRRGQVRPRPGAAEPASGSRAPASPAGDAASQRARELADAGAAVPIMARAAATPPSITTQARDRLRQRPLKAMAAAAAAGMAMALLTRLRHRRHPARA
ncbi:MAG TPA: YihY/virulence factor BrkB family protein [Burkholderiales bacterium]|nr:YihY/virulence factor BrkB family protein [Burkholderiales bacterium]